VKNITRDNHYVPQHLLKNFADDAGKLWIYDSELKKCRYGNTKSAGFECKLYPPEIEKILTQIIDTPGAEAISGLLQRKQLNGIQWASFLGFVAAQMQRTPACFNRIAAMVAPTMKETAERIAKFHKGFRANVRSSLKQAGATSDEITALFHAMETGRFKVTPTKEYVLWQSLKMIELLQAELKQMRWTILAVPNGEPNLIIGDQPAMLYDAGPDDEPPAPLGIRNRNIELVMPLGRRMVAIARWTGPDSYGELLQGSARVINERTLRCAHRFVFGPYKSDALLADAVRLRGTGPKIHVKRVQIGKGLAIIPEYS
jgi:hypothetical protein